jgi:hypothetical protein
MQYIQVGCNRNMDRDIGSKRKRATNKVYMYVCVGYKWDSAWYTVYDNLGIQVCMRTSDITGNKHGDFGYSREHAWAMGNNTEHAWRHLI